MAVKPIPDGYHSVTPYLTVVGAEALLEFVTRAFDAEEILRISAGDGSIGHAEVRIGDSMIMLGEAGEEWPAMPATIHLYVADCDATYRDPVGNLWWIATHVEDLTEDEMADRAKEWASRTA